MIRNTKLLGRYVYMNLNIKKTFKLFSWVCIFRKSRLIFNVHIYDRDLRHRFSFKR